MPSPNHKTRSSSVSLNRGSTGGNTLRRGDLKISEPIPIPREGKDGLGPQTGVGSPDFQNQTSLRHAQDGTTRAKLEKPAPAKEAENPTGDNDPSSGRSNTYNATTRISGANPHNSMSSAHSKDSSRNKGLRATFRKIFGRRGSSKRSTVEGLTDEHDQNAFASAATKAPVTRAPVRSSSFLPQDVTRSSALHSHSPLTPFLEVDNEARSNKAAGPHRRRNTLPSLVLSQQEEDHLRAMLGSPGIRPQSKGGPKVEKKEPMINNPNRRSRSAGALRETAREHRMSPIQWRRRSDEIKDWQDSANDRRDAEDMSKPSEAYSKLAELPRPPTRGNNTSQPGDPAAPPPPPIMMTSRQSFGDLLVPNQDDNASMDQRVTTIEVKLMDLEYAIAKLQGYEVPEPTTFSKQQNPRDTVQHYPSPHVSSQSLSSSNSYHPRGTFLSSPADSPNPSGDDEAFEDKRAQRASRATTVRPTTALHQPPSSIISNSAIRSPTSSHDTTAPTVNLDTSAFSHLLTMVQTEQAARRTLELQLQKLQREVEHLRSPSYPYFTSQPAYPTPSPESFSHDANPGPISTRRYPITTAPNPVVSRSAGTDPSSRAASSGENTRQITREQVRTQIQPSEFQSAFDDRSEDGTETDDDGFLDVYETPIESTENYNHGRFRSNESMRAEARTQQSMTLGMI
ncbi:MAG: hypothetical protein Q9227_006716 [Pyrenula ochraceoflavens]